tara:strand:- start:410 stop:721 length:312 start_codon:yes stop_codon:yes gene_type:complete
VVQEATKGDLVRWSRNDRHKYYLAGYAIVLEDIGKLIRIYWIGKTPVPLETLVDGSCWVYKSRCIVISKHGEPDYENLRYDRRCMVEGREEERKGKKGKAKGT